MKEKVNSTVKMIIPAVMLLCLLVIIPQWSSAYAQDGAQPRGRYSVEQLETLVGSVALYPDDLLSNILAASTLSNEIVEASVTLKSQGGVIQEMPDSDWDPSVKALLYFPSVLYYMDSNIYWTIDLGDAVISQQDDVIKAIQNYRKKAYDAGNLKSSEQQEVVLDGQVIKIESADPEVVYVPNYNYNDVLVAGHTGSPLLTFTAGVVVGDWMRYRTCNWNSGSLAVNPHYINYYNYPSNSAYYRNLQAKTANPNRWAPSSEARTQYDKHVRNRAAMPAPGIAAGGGAPGAPGANRPTYNNPNVYNPVDYRAGDRLRATASLAGQQPPPPGAFNNMNSGAMTQVQSNRGAASMGGFRGGRR